MCGVWWLSFRVQAHHRHTHTHSVHCSFSHFCAFTSHTHTEGYARALTRSHRNNCNGRMIASVAGPNSVILVLVLVLLVIYTCGCGETTVYHHHCDRVNLYRTSTNKPATNKDVEHFTFPLEATKRERVPTTSRSIITFLLLLK